MRFQLRDFGERSRSMLSDSYRSRPGPLKDALVHQLTQRFAHGGGAHIQTRGQVAFGYPLSRAKPSLKHSIAQGRMNLVTQGVGP